MYVVGLDFARRTLIVLALLCRGSYSFVFWRLYCDLYVSQDLRDNEKNVGFIQMQWTSVLDGP